VVHDTMSSSCRGAWSLARLAGVVGAPGPWHDELELQGLVVHGAGFLVRAMVVSS
jgi:hypothetical protein